ncbi:MAG TPA: hypothetical protein VE129_17825, partial [Thermoanaerobaculia bacterium]|nr:hypothetical protein [Thermoanaerobaculia bacterium]
MRDRLRGSGLSLALLALVLSGPARAADSPRPALPDSPAGRRVAAFFDAFRAGTPERLAAFFSGAVSPDGLKQRPAAERASRLAAIRKETGEVAIRRADAPAAGSVIVVTAGSAKSFTRWAFDFGPPPDVFLVGIAIDEADDSDL